MNYTIIDKGGQEVRTSYDFGEEWRTLDDAAASIAEFADWANTDLEEAFREAYDVEGDVEKLAEWDTVWLDDGKNAWTARRTPDGVDVRESGWVGEFREHFTREGYECMAEGGEDIERALKVAKAEEFSGYAKYPSTMAGIWGTMRNVFGDDLDQIVSDLDFAQLGNMLKLAKVAYAEGKEAGR